MGGRRTGPLIALVLLGALVVVWRLWQLQVVEHEIWAEQARLAMRFGQVLPYERGAIRDASGQPLSRDVAAYRLELNYRDFRRSHPLGLVAHARSVLLERPVSLPEAARTLYDDAAELVSLSPGELYAFGRGAALARETFQLPATSEPYREERPSRAADLFYYCKALFELEKSERARLVKLERSPAERRSYLELVAELRHMLPEDLFQERLAAWRRAGEALGDLAERLPWRSGELDRERPALDHLIGQLEAWRASLEDAAAARLFADVLGFEAGRIEPALLIESIDLDFLAREMGWDAPRLMAWAWQTRAAFLRSWRDGFALERLLAELRLSEEHGADFTLSLMASLYADGAEFSAALDGEPTPWYLLEHPAVFPALDVAFELSSPPPALVEPPLEVFEPGWRAQRDSAGAAKAELLALLTEPSLRRGLEARFAAELGEAWERQYPAGLADVWRKDPQRGSQEARERVRAAAVALLDSFELTFQARLRERLKGLAPLSGSADGRLRVAKDHLDRLSERVKSLLKDYGSRPAVLHQSPSDEVVYLLSRFGERFAGIEVKAYRERERLGEVLPGDSANTPRAIPLARVLVGSVSALDAEAMQRQRDKKQELDSLKGKVTRTNAEEQRLRSLMQELLLADEARGVSGIEGYLDLYLRGQNGYRERLGLEDVYGRGARSVSLSEVRDGQDVWLTLDPALQAASQRLINKPKYPAYDPKADSEWFKNPVGAIVLATPDGRLLAMASAPDASQAGLLEHAEGQRSLILERTLSKPTFQPLGSVFKPFVAAYALDSLAGIGFDEHFEHTCEAPRGALWAEWGGVRCHSQYGHGRLDLIGALHVSCNCYFARLGDDLGPAGIAQVAAAFGFGQPTGIEPFERAGPGFESVPKILQWNQRADQGRQVRRAANGLQVIEGTPAQLARALCGLATGKLPSLRLIDRVGEQFLPVPPPTPVPFSAHALGTVAKAMAGVANARDGSGYAELNRRRIGLAIAVKTGSADLVARAVPGTEGVRRAKHTWLAGWAPAENPKLIFAVFLHDTVATAGHSAAVVGRQLFELPELRLWLAAAGVELNAPTASPTPVIQEASFPRYPRGGVR